MFFLLFKENIWFILVIIDSGGEKELSLWDGVRVVVVKAGGERQAGRLAAQLFSSKVVQGLAKPLLQPGCQLAGLAARGAQHSVTPKLLLRGAQNVV